MLEQWVQKNKNKKVSTVDIFEESQRLLYGKNSKGIIIIK